MTLPPQQFCVRWNSYHTNLQTVFPKLLSTENFADVTLACENRQLKCHKVVLSACSAYFERLLVQNPCKHPIIFMKDMRFSEMSSLVDFMYKGEVNVTQDDLPSLLKSAEALQIRGLCASDNNGLTNSTGGSDNVQTEKSDNSTEIPSKDYTLASNALMSQMNGRDETPSIPNGGQPPNIQGLSNVQNPNNAMKKRKLYEDETFEGVKEECVEEDGLYYGDIDNDGLEFHDTGEDSAIASSSTGNPASDPIANVTCEYQTIDTDSCASTGESIEIRSEPTGPETNQGPIDHNYEQRDPIEPPAFIIKQVHVNESERRVIVNPYGNQLDQSQLLAMGQKLLVDTNMSKVNMGTNTPVSSSAAVNDGNLQGIKFVNIQPLPIGGEINLSTLQTSIQNALLQSAQSHPNNLELGNTRRIRRSEVQLKEAADCVTRGQTFQNVSDMFNIPISTIRFFMARKGILPRRKRGRSSHLPMSGQNQSMYSEHATSNTPASSSPQHPPYYMQHYKLPDMLAIASDTEDKTD